jgi:hypothetical protein
VVDVNACSKIGLLTRAGGCCVALSILTAASEEGGPAFRLSPFDQSRFIYMVASSALAAGHPVL